MTRRAAIIVLDGVGIGEAPDAATTATLAATRSATSSRAVGGYASAEPRNARARQHRAARRRCSRVVAERRVGTDGSAVGREGQHDRATGRSPACISPKPFPTYPNGFPPEVVDEFERRTGRRVIGNVVGSGTAVIERIRPGAPADRVHGFCTRRPIRFFRSRRTKGSFRSTSCIAAARSRARCSLPPHDVSRVIARPFVGQPGRTRERRTGAITRSQPPAETLLDALERGWDPADVAWARWTICSPAEAITSTPHGDQRRGDRGDLEWLAEPVKWVTVREPSRFRPSFRAPERRFGVLWCAARVRCGAPGTAGSLTRGRSAVHHRRPRQRSDDSVDRPRARMRAVAGARSARSSRPRSAAARRSPISGATIGEWLGDRDSADGERPFSRSWSLARMAVEQRPGSRAARRRSDDRPCCASERSPPWSARTRRTRTSGSARRCWRSDGSITRRLQRRERVVSRGHLRGTERRRPRRWRAATAASRRL